MLSFGWFKNLGILISHIFILRTILNFNFYGLVINISVSQNVSDFITQGTELGSSTTAKDMAENSKKAVSGSYCEFE